MKKHSLQNLHRSVVFCRLPGGLSGYLRCAAVMVVITLTACVYKLDIQQGNIVEREKVAQLKLGMSKRQVRFILGTPLVIDTFNQDRWDYYYSIKDYSPDNSEGAFHQERLTLFFDKEQLVNIDNQLSADVGVPVADPDQAKREIPETSEANP